MPNALDFMFQINPEVPRGKVAVKPLPTPGKWLVMAATPLSNAQIVMAIGRFIAKHDPESGTNRPEDDLPLG